MITWKGLALLCSVICLNCWSSWKTLLTAAVSRLKVKGDRSPILQFVRGQSEMVSYFQVLPQILFHFILVAFLSLIQLSHPLLSVFLPFQFIALSLSWLFFPKFAECCYKWRVLLKDHTAFLLVCLLQHTPVHLDFMLLLSIFARLHSVVLILLEYTTICFHLLETCLV